MTDRPLTLPEADVLACLERRKTQHRTVLEPQPKAHPFTIHTDATGSRYTIDDAGVASKLPCAAGDRYWVHDALTLTVTDVRVQPLQEISFEDCRAEGADPCFRERVNANDCPDPSCHGEHLGEKWHFQSLWDARHKNPAHQWEANPWVCALTWDVDPRNIDEVTT